MSDIVVSSRVRLARNYEDLPFKPRMSAAQADQCIERTLGALRTAPQTYRYLAMRGTEEVERQVLVEGHLISPDLMADVENGAVLIRDDGAVSVMMNEEDHLRIQAFTDGEDLASAALAAYQVEDALQGSLKFAFDSQWGYLTACPTNTGTGMRASVMLHLPMLTALKQMGKVTQLAAKLGLTIRGIYGEGSEAQGNLYQLSNQVTLGRTEEDILAAVAAVARQMAGMEEEFRNKAYQKDSAAFEDQIWRSLGIAQNARRMGIKEFMLHFSNLRMGAAMGLLPLTTEVCDRLLTTCQPGHVQLTAGKALTIKEIDKARSDILRAELTED